MKIFSPLQKSSDPSPFSPGTVVDEKVKIASYQNSVVVGVNNRGDTARWRGEFSHGFISSVVAGEEKAQGARTGLTG